MRPGNTLDRIEEGVEIHDRTLIELLSRVGKPVKIAVGETKSH